MEEDIKILEEMKKDIVYDSDEDYDNQIAMRQIQAIENLIKGYRKLQYRVIKYEKTLETLQKETIWKSKIKEKIEEWDKSIKWNNADDCYYAIRILHELMEDK